MTNNLIKKTIEPRANIVSPFGVLQSDINRLFDDFFLPFDMGRDSFETQLLRVSQPRMDVVEKDKEYEIKVDLPGMKESDINVEIHDGVLTISGETSQENEDKRKNYHLCERQYASFKRSVSLSKDIDEAKGGATFKNGVLIINLPKTLEAQKTPRKLEIKEG